MMRSNLYQTAFHIEKLMNAVNVGKGSAYQIFTVPGKQLGQFGQVTLPGMRPAANEELFNPEPSPDTAETKSLSWFKRALAAFIS